MTVEGGTDPGEEDGCRGEGGGGGVRGEAKGRKEVEGRGEGGSTFSIIEATKWERFLICGLLAVWRYISQNFTISRVQWSEGLPFLLQVHGA